MADEFRHKDVVSGRITEDEFENVNQHIFNSQAVGDLLYASGLTQLSRLGITNDRILVSSGGVPVWSATLPAFTLAGTVTLNGQAFDAGSGDAQINTTGSLKGLIVAGSSGTSGARIYLRHTHTTPEATKFAGILDFEGYDGAGAPVLQTWGRLGLKYTNVGDGTEQGTFEFQMMAAGVANNLAMTLSGAGVLDVDASSGLGAATVGEFDEYDDAMILKQGISDKALEKLEEIGVLSRKDSGSGWMLNIQAMLYLLAGGVYQNRARIDEINDRLLALP